MFNRILVPLDGSALAEEAIAPAAMLAKNAPDSSIILVHVIERHPPNSRHNQTHLALASEAKDYLEAIKSRCFDDPRRVEIHVHEEGEKDIAQSIADHAQEYGVDLVVMCGHGAHGLRQFMSGSLAEQAMSRGRIPVLYLRARRKGRALSPSAGPLSIKSILVPLDSCISHSHGIDLSSELAKSLGASITLTIVIPTLGTLRGNEAACGQLSPSATGEALEMEMDSARESVNDLLAGLRAKGIECSGEIVRGDPAIAIARLAKRKACDLVVLATHGKTGMKAFWSDSTSARIAQRLRSPLLLVPEKAS